MLLATQLHVNGTWVVTVARCAGERLMFGLGLPQLVSICFFSLAEYPCAETRALLKCPEQPQKGMPGKSRVFVENSSGCRALPEHRGVPRLQAKGPSYLTPVSD